jgi:hypothetical protein
VQADGFRWRASVLAGRLGGPRAYRQRPGWPAMLLSASTNAATAIVMSSCRSLFVLVGNRLFLLLCGVATLQGHPCAQGAGRQDALPAGVQAHALQVGIGPAMYPARQDNWQLGAGVGCSCWLTARQILLVFGWCGGAQCVGIKPSQG